MARTLLLRAATAAVLSLAFTAPFAVTGLALEDATRDGPAVEDASRTPADVAMELDFLIAEAWRTEGLEPTTRCTDAEFVRRVFLDVTGAIPTPDQVRRFVRDEEPTKRRRLVDSLLESPGYARHFTNRWAQVLVGQGTGANNGREFVPGLFRIWLEKQLTADRPWGEVVTDLIAANGTVYDSPPVNFAGRRDHSATDVAGATSKAFLGVQIQCAQCHDHPYESITQADFNSFAAFWAYTYGLPKEIDYSVLGSRAVERAKQRYEKDVATYVEQGKTQIEAEQMASRRRQRSRDIRDWESQPQSRNPRVARRMLDRNKKRLGDIAEAEPKFLLGATYEDAAGQTRRGALAAWIVDPQNPYTAPALANRYWGWLLGRGFVHPVDDFSSVNIPSVPAALRLLAQDTADHRFDLKRLIRVITHTHAYQLSTRAPERTPLAEEFFAAGPLKELTPQEAFDSLQIALGVSKDATRMSGLTGAAPAAIDMAGRGGMMMAGGAAELSRAERLLQGAARSYFQTFDDDEGGDAEAFTGTVPQGLFLMNGAVVNNLLVQPRISVVPGIVDGLDKESDRIRELYLRTLSREPTKDEVRRLVHFVKNAETTEQAVEVTDAKTGKKKKQRRRRTGELRTHAAYADVLWALLSTSEFATNH